MKIRNGFVSNSSSSSFIVSNLTENQITRIKNKNDSLKTNCWDIKMLTENQMELSTCIDNFPYDENCDCDWNKTCSWYCFLKKIKVLKKDIGDEKE